MERPLLVSQLGLRSGTVVRIARPGFSRVQGRLVRATDHTLILIDYGSEHTVPLTFADTVWTASGSTKRAAIKGGLIGLVPAVALYALAEGMCDVEKCDGQGALVATGVGIVGITAFIGALAGLRSEWWRRLP